MISLRYKKEKGLFIYDIIIKLGIFYLIKFEPKKLTKNLFPKKTLFNLFPKLKKLYLSTNLIWGGKPS